MLGLYNYIANSKAVQSIVRGGLQLFYKADRTQAPLGEEQVRNNSFDELGIDEVTDGDFPLNTTAWIISSASYVTFGDGFVDIDRAASSDAYIYQDILEVGKTYQVTFSGVINTGSLFLGINDVRTIFGAGEYTNETFTFTVIAGFNPNLFIIRTSNTNIDIDARITNVSVKQLDPNNRWLALAGATIESNGARINNTVTSGVAAIKQTISNPSDRTFEFTYDIVATDGSTLVVQQLSNIDLDTTTVGTNRKITFTWDLGIDDLIIKRKSGATDVTIDNVSLREITNSIKDHSKNSNDGILYSGKALEFDTDDGSNDFIVLNDANLTGEFTVCTWVEPHSHTQCNIFGDTANQNWIRIHSALSITVKIAGTSTGYVELTHGGNIALNEWSRVVVTRGSDNIIRFGINGVFYSPSTTPRAGNFNFNRLGIKDNEEMNGALADVQVYDKAWNATDVEFDYNNPDKDVFDRVGEAQVIGDEEKVENGDFSTATTDWSEGPGWDIDVVNNKAKVNATNYTDLSQNIGTVSNGTYKIEFKVSDYVSGSVQVILGYGGSPSVGSATVNDNGVYEAIVTTNPTNPHNVYISTITPTTQLSIDYISVKEVTTHASHILPTDCKSLLRLNEGAGDRVYDAAPVLGAEEITNGDFSNGETDWDFGDGWSLVNDKASLVQVGSPGATDHLIQEITGLTNGALYQIQFDLDIISGSTTIGISNSGAFGQLSSSYRFYTTSSTKTIISVYNSSHASGSKYLRFVGGNNTAFTINNVSVKEIKPAESFFITGDKNFLHQQPHIPQYAMSSFSKKMVFDGSNDYLACGSDASIDDIFTGGGTFSAWISVSSDGGENIGTIMGKGTVSVRVKEDDNGGVMLNLAKGFSNTNADFLTSDEVILENKMNHIAITYDDSSSSNTPSFYVNGVSTAIDTGNSTIPVGSASADASSDLIIGNALAGGTRSFDGIIDEVSLFKTELTQDEVLELYNSGSSFDSTGHSKYNLGEEVSNSAFELGSEKVQNGDFSDGTTLGWTFVNLTADISNNTLKLTSTTATNNRAFYNISTEVGKTYQMSADVKSSASNSEAGIGGIGTTTPLSFEDGANADSFTTLKFVFTATLETTQIRLLNSKQGTWGGLGSIAEFDNVSVKEIPNWELRPGWSVNNNTAVYDGTGAQYARLIQTLSTVVGRTYQMTFTLSGLSSGDTVNFGLGRNGSFNGYDQQTYSSNGTHTRIMQAQSIDDDIVVQINQADANCTVSNISVQEYGLSAYWRNNGADQWDDLSINSNHGTVSGSPTEIFLQEVPFFGKDSLGMFMNRPRLGGLNFNKSGYVETGSPFQSTFRDSFSICLWFKFPDGRPSTGVRFLGHDVGEDELFISLEDDGKSKFQFRSNNDRVISETDAAIASNNQTDWIYLTLTVTKASTIGDAQIIFYKDGSAVDSSLVGSETLTQANMEAYTQTQNLVLGAFNADGTIASDTCDGIIDDFKIYSKALTPAEIKKNYNATKGKHKN